MIQIENLQNLPKLYDTEDTPEDEKILQIKFYDINSNWQWYLVEYNPNEKIAFGYVIGHEKEWGYFSLQELDEIPTIIQDDAFQPIMFKDL